MRGVIDTNVFVTALLKEQTSQRVYQAFLDGLFILLFSPDTLAELLEVLSRTSLRVLLSEPEVRQFLALIQRDGLIVHPTTSIQACRDPKDNMFLDCALAGEATYLATADKDLLVLNPFRSIRILRPSEFMRLLV